MTDHLTSIQRQTLAVIRQHVTKHGFSPSIREVAVKIDRAVSTTHTIIRGLESKGHLTFEEGKIRTMRPRLVEAE